MDLQVVIDALPFLFDGMLVTLVMSVSGMACGMLLGILVCAARMSNHAPTRRFGAVYVSIFRGVPLVVQLMLVFYALPVIGIVLPAYVAALIALSFCAAAYIGEILRGGLLVIPKGHIEAARMLGFSMIQVWRRILIPQALVTSLPSLINELILLLKASSLISVIGIAELTRTSQNIAASTYRPLEIYLAAATFYLVLNLLLAMAGRAAERRLAPAIQGGKHGR
ncbi:MAG: amino acid ABC transporter permease [Pseudomonadota bacterium]